MAKSYWKKFCGCMYSVSLNTSQNLNVVTSFISHVAVTHPPQSNDRELNLDGKFNLILFNLLGPVAYHILGYLD